jgi:hypothetical protein
MGLHTSIGPCPYIPSICMLKPKRLTKVLRHVAAVEEVKSSQTLETLTCTRGIQVEPGLGTFNFTGIKKDASVAVLQAVVSGKCVQLLIGSAHVAGQSRDR